MAYPYLVIEFPNGVKIWLMGATETAAPQQAAAQQEPSTSTDSGNEYSISTDDEDNNVLYVSNDEHRLDWL